MVSRNSHNFAKFKFACQQTAETRATFTHRQRERQTDRQAGQTQRQTGSQWSRAGQTCVCCSTYLGCVGVFCLAKLLLLPAVLMAMFAHLQ